MLLYTLLCSSIPGWPDTPNVDIRDSIVVVRFYRGSKKLRAVEVKVKRDGKVGRFTVGYAPRRTGRASWA